MPWLSYLMSHLYTSLATALKVNKAFLIHSSKDFRTLIKEDNSPVKINESNETIQSRKFVLRESAHKIYGLRRKHFLNRTAKN